METGLFKKIGFCTDFSENADQSFVVATEFAVQYGASIEIIHVTVHFDEIIQSHMHYIHEKYVKKLPAGLPCNVNIVSGYPSTEILRIVKNKSIDLLVMGTHGLTGIAHVLFGSTADRLVRSAPCSVLTVRFRQP
jgi:nucleotide-binding universal stress UspA family protein